MDSRILELKGVGDASSDKGCETQPGSCLVFIHYYLCLSTKLSLFITN